MWGRLGWLDTVAITVLYRIPVFPFCLFLNRVPTSGEFGARYFLPRRFPSSATFYSPHSCFDRCASSAYLALSMAISAALSCSSIVIASPLIIAANLADWRRRYSETAQAYASVRRRSSIQKIGAGAEDI